MLKVTGHHAVGYTHYCRGEYAEAIRHADAGLALFDLEQEQRIASIFQFSSSCALWWFRGQAQLVIGQAQGASESLQRAQTLVEELLHVPSRAYLLSQRCLSYHARDDVDQVETLARALRSLSVAEGFGLWVPFADIFLAWTTARKGGNASAAAEKITAAMALVHQGLTHILDIEFGSMLAEALLLASRPEKVFQVTDDVLATTRPGKVRHFESELFRLRGEAARAMGDASRAVSCFRQGIDSARSMGARLLELRSTFALARLTGANEERMSLKGVLDGFTEGLDQADVTQALAFLAARDSAGPQNTPVNLTDRAP
jgi:hypothetical protein